MSDTTHDHLAEELIDRVRVTVPSKDLAAVLQQVTGSIVEMGIADGAGVTERVGRESFVLLAPTSGAVAAIDALQHELDEGPSVQAVYSDGVIVSQNLAAEDRWPRWAAAAAEHGFRSILSVNLYTVGDTIGALNLYSARPRDYTTDDLETAKLLGSHASTVLARYRSDTNLWRAIDARHRVGLAQGLLMERFDITIDQAFAVLLRYSQHRNLKLQLVADHLITTRTLPNPPLPSRPPNQAGPDIQHSPARTGGQPRG